MFWKCSFLALIVAVVTPSFCSSDLGVNSNPNTPSLSVRALPEFKKFSKSICEYTISEGKIEAYNVELVLDPSWKCDELEPLVLSMLLWKGCPEYKGMDQYAKGYSRPYITPKESLCYIRFRLSRNPRIPYSYPELGALACLEMVFRCLGEAIEADLEKLPEKCVAVKKGEFWTNIDLPVHL